MKLYDLVKEILENHSQTRSSDKALIWEVLRRRSCLRADSLSEEGVLDYNGFTKAPTFESITRARRKVQEVHPELQAVEEVRRVREEMSRGNPIDMFNRII
jgi:tRNA G37 N-methylase TrmD